jgi:hypothetical protein
VVRMEEDQMDINVWAGQRLILYVENKETREKALALLKKMRQYGESGFDLDALDKGNDPLRKAKYLFRNEHRPEYFALSAVRYRQLFSVEYLGTSNRSRLVDAEGDITAPLLSAKIVGTPPARSVADSLAIEFQRLLAETGTLRNLEAWMSPGTRGTAFNLYVFRPSPKKHAITAGVYKNGEIWTDLKGVGDSLANRLSTCLAECGISVDTGKEDAFWRRGGSRFVAGVQDAIPVAEAVIKALKEAELSASI